MSTNEKKYNLVFERKLKEGEDLDVVKERLKKFFKGNPQAVEKLFLKKSCVIKKNITIAEAEKYQTVIESVGAECVIEAINNENGKKQMSSEVNESSSKTNATSKKYILWLILILLIATLSLAGKFYLDNPGALNESSNGRKSTLITHGALTKNSVATGAALKAYSGFGKKNYLEQAYSSELDFGVDDFYVMGWVKKKNSPQNILLNRKGIGKNGMNLHIDIRMNGANIPYMLLKGYKGKTYTIKGANAGEIADNTWQFLTFLRKNGVIYLYRNAMEDAKPVNVPHVGAMDAKNSNLTLGIGQRKLVPASATHMSLWRIGSGAPSPEQIKEIYEREKILFKENSKCSTYQLPINLNNVVDMGQDC